MEEKVVDPSRNSVSVSVQGGTWHVNSITIQIADHVDFVDLRLEPQVNLVFALRPTTKATAGNGWIVELISARGDADIVNAFAKRCDDPRIFTEIIVVAANLGQPATAK